MRVLNYLRACGLISLAALASVGVEAQPSGELTITISGFGRERMDPGMATSNDLILNGHIYDGLIGASANGELSAERGLAESWEMTNDAISAALMQIRRFVSAGPEVRYGCARTQIGLDHAITIRPRTCTRWRSRT